MSTNENSNEKRESNEKKANEDKSSKQAAKCLSNSDKIYKCDVCDTSISGRSNYRCHLKGKRHKNKLKLKEKKGKTEEKKGKTEEKKETKEKRKQIEKSKMQRDDFRAWDGIPWDGGPNNIHQFHPFYGGNNAHHSNSNNYGLYYPAPYKDYNYFDNPNYIDHSSNWGRRNNFFIEDRFGNPDTPMPDQCPAQSNQNMLFFHPPPRGHPGRFRYFNHFNERSERTSRNSNQSSESINDNADNANEDINLNPEKEKKMCESTVSSSSKPPSTNNSSPKPSAIRNKQGRRISLSSPRLSSDNGESSKAVDGANEMQKAGSTLLESYDRQITRLINPSNFKDKAIVNQLITKMSKSKRTLLRMNLQSDPADSANMESSDTLVAENIKKITKENLESVNSEQVTSSESVIDSQILDNLSNVQSFHFNFNAADSSCNLNEENHDGQVDSSVSLNETTFKSKGRRLSKVSAKKKNSKSSTPGISKKSVKRKTQSATVKKTKKVKGNPSICTKSAKVKSSKDIDANEISSTTPASTDMKYKVSNSRGAEVIYSKQAFVESSLQSEPDKVLDFTSVDALIDLFASGNVLVKKEYDDPVIDSIKAVDPNTLLEALKSNTVNDTTTKQKVEMVESTHRGNSEYCDNEEDNDESTLSPVILGCLVNDESTSENIVYASSNNTCDNQNKTKDDTLNQHVTVNEVDFTISSENSEIIHENCSSAKAEKENLDDTCVSFDKEQHLKVSLSQNSADFIEKNKSALSPKLQDFIKELQQISSKEETVKQSLHEIKSKIQDLTVQLEDCKRKKMKLHNEEENLRLKRNNIIQLMEGLVHQSSETNKTSCEKLENLANSSFSETEKDPADNSMDDTFLMEELETGNLPTMDCSEKNTNDAQSDSEEISIVPCTIPEKEIIVIDIAEDGEDDKSSVFSIKTNIVPVHVPSIYEQKNMEAHPTVVNCLLVFEDYLYTCSNDSTAKRFSIKDPSQTVTYLHPNKCVEEITVEAVQSVPLVFTSCSSKVLCIFHAANGALLKSFSKTCSVASICKGWGTFYAGFDDGSITQYNWKFEEKDVVKCDYAISRIATAYQGRLHLLVLLSTNGTIYVRDAETGLLIRSIKGFVKLPCWMAVQNDMAYFCSYDKTLTILDITTGRFERKLYLTGNVTGLSVYDDYLFTVSYSGLVNCYNKDKVSDKKLYYGAGKNGLTSLYCHQDWVFTGNRKGQISVFKFDPQSSAPCQYGHCSYVFGFKEDLEYHVESVHFDQKGLIRRCYWGICHFAFPHDWDVEARRQHIKKHIYQNVITQQSV